MPSQPLVSVIITCYNKGPWIGQCIQSALGQTVRDLEVIVVDDASTDQSAEVIRSLREQDERIRAVSHAENQGIACTWKEAVGLARGSYIARCDGDDYWSVPDKLEQQLTALKEAGSLWCNCDFDMVDEEGKLLQACCFESGATPLANTFEKMLATRGFTNASTWLMDADFMRAACASLGSNVADDTFDLQLWMHLRTTLATVPGSLVACRMVRNSDSRKSPEGMVKRSQGLMRQQQVCLHSVLQPTAQDEPYPPRAVDIPSLLEALLGEQENLNEAIIGRDERLMEATDEVAKVRAERDSLRAELDSVYGSKRWKLASRMASPFGR